MTRTSPSWASAAGDRALQEGGVCLCRLDALGVNDLDGVGADAEVVGVRSAWRGGLSQARRSDRCEADTSGVLLQAAVTGAGEDRVRLEQEERLGRAHVADAERGEHVLEAVGCHLDGHVVKRGGYTGEVVDA